MVLLLRRVGGGRPGRAGWHPKYNGIHPYKYVSPAPPQGDPNAAAGGALRTD